MVWALPLEVLELLALETEEQRAVVCSENLLGGYGLYHRASGGGERL